MPASVNFFVDSSARRYYTRFADYVEPQRTLRRENVSIMARTGFKLDDHA